MYPIIYIGDRAIGTYGMCMLLGFLLAGICAYRKGKQFGIHLEDLLIIIAFALAGGLICGGLLYVFVTYSISEIILFIKQGDFRFLASGLIFYGGLIGGILGALLGVRIAGCGLYTIERSVVPFIPLGHAIGRIGCIMAGCCHGFEYSGPFALYYPNSLSGLPQTQGYFPVQPLESVINLGICLILLRVERKSRKTLDLLFIYLLLYSITRFFLEMLRGDGIRGMWNSLSTSQWVSLAIITVCAFRYLIIFKKNHN